jgi:hypothetical protein
VRVTVFRFSAGMYFQSFSSSGVYQVGYHVMSVAVDVFFARVMKVELRQLVDLVADGQSAPLRISQQNGMAIINNR